MTDSHPGWERSPAGMALGTAIVFSIFAFTGWLVLAAIDLLQQRRIARGPFSYGSIILGTAIWVGFGYFLAWRQSTRPLMSEREQQQELRFQQKLDEVRNR